MDQRRDIEYRRLVSNIARELNDKDIEQIAYIRLAGKEDTTKYSAAKPCASALDLMMTLERFDVFSRDDIAGLIEVVKDARRKDLMRKIKEYMAEDAERRASLSSRPAVTKKPTQNGRQSAAHERAGHCSQQVSMEEPHLEQRKRDIARELSLMHGAAQSSTSPHTGSNKSNNPLTTFCKEIARRSSVYFCTLIENIGCDTYYSRSNVYS